MVTRQNDVSKEALSRLPKLDIRNLREQWRRLYKADASPCFSRELLMRAIGISDTGSGPARAAAGAAAPAPPAGLMTSVRSLAS
jgi:hypothetical protein